MAFRKSEAFKHIMYNLNKQNFSILLPIELKEKFSSPQKHREKLFLP